MVTKKKGIIRPERELGVRGRCCPPPPAVDLSALRSRRCASPASAACAASFIGTRGRIIYICGGHCLSHGALHMFMLPLSHGVLHMFMLPLSHGVLHMFMLPLSHGVLHMFINSRKNEEFNLQRGLINHHQV